MTAIKCFKTQCWVFAVLGLLLVPIILIVHGETMFLMYCLGVWGLCSLYASQASEKGPLFEDKDSYLLPALYIVALLTIPMLLAGLGSKEASFGIFYAVLSFLGFLGFGIMFGEVFVYVAKLVALANKQKSEEEDGQ